MQDKPEQLDFFSLLAPDPVCDNVFKQNKTRGYGEAYWDLLNQKNKKELTKKEKKALKDKKYKETHKEALLIKKKEYSDKIWAIRKEKRKKILKEEFDRLSQREEEKEWQPLKNWDYFEIRLKKDTQTIEIRYKHNKKIIKPCFDKGVYRYHLDDKNKKTSLTVHSLTAVHYIENPNNYTTIIHIDGDRSNNKISNLKWSKKICKMGSANHASKGVINVYKNGVFQFQIDGSKKEIKDRGFNDSSVYKCVYGVQKTYKGYTFIRESLTEEEKKAYIKKQEKVKIQNRPKRVKYMLLRIKNDVNFKILTILRKRIRNVLKSKKNKKCFKSSELLGCSIEHARKHIESQFKEGMTWDNHGKYGWHIDHIIPCASFDLTDPEQQKKCFHYTNLQPLWWNENLSKGAKIIT
jgi:hypothetical protein